MEETRHIVPAAEWLCGSIREKEGGVEAGMGEK